MFAGGPVSRNGFPGGAQRWSRRFHSRTMTYVTQRGQFLIHDGPETRR